MTLALYVKYWKLKSDQDGLCERNEVEVQRPRVAHGNPAHLSKADNRNCGYNRLDYALLGCKLLTLRK